MNKKDKNLGDLINDFLSKVDSATSLLEKRFDTRNILRLWRSNQIQRCGDILTTPSTNFMELAAPFTSHQNQWTLIMVRITESTVLIYGAFTFTLATGHLNIKNTATKKTVEKEFQEYVASGRIEKMSTSDNLYILVKPELTGK
nr:hypothetical protein [Pseudomonas koreensis]